MVSWWFWFREWLDSPSFGQWFYPWNVQHSHTCFFFSGIGPSATKFRIISLKISRSFTLNHCGIASVTSNAIPCACFQADFAFTVVGHLDRWMGLVCKAWDGGGYVWVDVETIFFTPPQKKQKYMCLLVGSWQFFWWYIDSNTFLFMCMLVFGQGISYHGTKNSGILQCMAFLITE